MKEKLKIRAKEIDESLKQFIKGTDNAQKRIYEAAEYSVFAGGKRLRPILLLETYKMCGGEQRGAMNFACAMEMIHTYSLIHDDLPAMDNDDFRRGKPTNHKVFGEAMAILAGDALLNAAFETALLCADIECGRVISALKIMAESSGWDGMIGGQVIDIESENKDITIDELKIIHSLKTGALIKASCMIGAVLAGADSSELDAVQRYSENLGVAFQIQDDILDVTGDEKQLGKPVGSDEKNHKSTYVTLCGTDNSRKLAKGYFNDALSALELFGKRANFLREFTGYIVNRNS